MDYTLNGVKLTRATRTLKMTVFLRQVRKGTQKMTLLALIYMAARAAIRLFITSGLLQFDVLCYFDISHLLTALPELEFRCSHTAETPLWP